MEENKEAWLVYVVCSRQVRTVNGQPVDLDITAIKIVMDLYGIRDQRRCLDKVLFIARRIVNARVERQSLEDFERKHQS